MDQLPSSKVEMLERIEREAKSRGCSLSKIRGSDFIIKSDGSEIRGNVRETGRGKVKHPKEMWVGIWGPTLNFLKELNDDSRCFIVELDYLKGNFLTIPLSLIPKECWHPYGEGRGQSFHIFRNDAGYSIRIRERTIALGDYTNNIEVLFKPLTKGEKLAPSIITPVLESKMPSPPIASAPALTHSELLDILVELGEFYGKHSEREHLSGPYRYDVVWKRTSGGNPTKVFEVHHKGVLDSALAKLKHAYDIWNSDLFLVIIDPEDKGKAKTLLTGSFHEICEVTTIIQPEEVKEIFNYKKRFRELEKKLR